MIRTITLAARLGWTLSDQRPTDEIATRMDRDRRTVEEHEERRDPTYCRCKRAGGEGGSRRCVIKRYFNLEWPAIHRFHLMVNSSIGNAVAVHTIVDAVAKYRRGGSEPTVLA